VRCCSAQGAGALLLSTAAMKTAAGVLLLYLRQRQQQHAWPGIMGSVVYACTYKVECAQLSCTAVAQVWHALHAISHSVHSNSERLLADVVLNDSLAKAEDRHKFQNGCRFDPLLPISGAAIQQGTSCWCLWDSMTGAWVHSRYGATSAVLRVHKKSSRLSGALAPTKAACESPNITERACRVHDMAVACTQTRCEGS
jgi:hypothetical protein